MREKQKTWMIVLSVLIVCSAVFGGESDEVLGDGILKPHQGQWQFNAGTWSAQGSEEPGGWYLRSNNQYDMKSVEFSVKKEQADGYVYLYTGDWRVLLKKDSLIVSYMAKTDALRKDFRRNGYFWYNAMRPIQFDAGTWNKCRLALDGNSVKVFWNDKLVVDWISPDQEWGERIRNCDRVGLAKEWTFPKTFPANSLEGKDQIAVLHGYQTPLEFKGIKIDGKATGPAQGFHTPAWPTKEDGRYHEDAVTKQIVPQGSVVVNWQADAAAVKAAGVLPQVDGWEIPKGDMVSMGIQAASMKEGLPPVEASTSPEYFIGREGKQQFPQNLWGPRGEPRKVKIYFNLKEAGEYTFVNEDFSIGAGPHPVEVCVDGKPVSRVLYRPVTRDIKFNDFVPLKLDKGPHVVTVEFLMTQVNLLSYLMREQGVTLGRIALVKGIVEPLIELKAGQVEKQELAKDAELNGEYTGKTIVLRVSGLTPGQAYQILPLFYEVEARLPGARLMDIGINGKVVATDLDVFKDGGFRKSVEKRFEGKAGTDGEITLTLKGKNNKAIINALKVIDSQGKTVCLKNWSGAVDPEKRNIYFNPSFATSGGSAPPKWTATMPFDGHNLIANPHLSLTDKDRKGPMAWYSLKDVDENTREKIDIEGYYGRIAPPELLDAWKKMVFEPSVVGHYKILLGEGEYRHNKDIGHEHPGSLEIGKTGEAFGISPNWPFIDYGKTQEFSFWVKADKATGKVFAEIYWLTSTQFSDLNWQTGGNALPTPQIVLLGKSTGTETLTGTRDWTKITIHAKPPYGAFFAVPVVRVDNNSAGTFWIDDAELNGYGADPLEISYSFLGFHPKSDKQFTVKSLSKEPVTWELLDGTGKAVKTGQAAYHSYEELSKRHYFTVDLSGFETSGTYRLNVSQAGNTQKTESFKIDAGVYREFCAITQSGVYGARQNAAVQDLYDPEELDDAQATLAFADSRYSRLEQPMTPERKNALGGYCDAGDQYKKPFSWPGVLLSAASMYELVSPAVSQRTRDDALDEMLWALKSFQTLQHENGSMPVSVLPYAYRQLDNIPRFGADRMVEDKDHPVPNLAGAAAMSAYLLKDKDKAWSEIAKHIALKNYAYNFDKEASQKRDATIKSIAANHADPQRKELFLRLATDGKALIAEIYLYKLTGEEKYKSAMEEHAKTLITALNQKAYRMVEKVEIDKEKKLFEMKDVVPVQLVGSTTSSGVAQDFVMALCLFARNYPEHPLTVEAKQALRVFANDVKRVSEISPYGQAYDLATPENQEPKRWPMVKGQDKGGVEYGAATYWAMLAYNLSQIGMLLDDPDMVRLAERQLQWCLGRNITDCSAIQGVGARTIAVSDGRLTSRAFMESYLQGNSRQYSYKGTVVGRAFCAIGNGELHNMFEKGDAKHPVVPTGSPQGYLNYSVMGDTLPAFGPNECFTPLYTPMVFAAAGIQEALAWLEKRKP